MTASTRYRLTHETHYKYDDPVAICRNQLRMLPRSFANRLTEVVCESADITIDPEPHVVNEYTDYFGNKVVAFSIESLHRELRVTARSALSIIQRAEFNHLTDIAWEQIVESIDGTTDGNWLEVQEFTTNSARLSRGRPFADYAKEVFTPGRPILQASLELTKKIHAEFKYDTKATDVSTPLSVSFEKRAGVCQDFAHIQIACLRSIGLPARYVSGYLRTEPEPGQERLIGADESHAWISVYAGDTVGWIDLDPTNACIAGLDHIGICMGRDYDEVSPMRGVVLGGGANQLTVQVDVEPLET